MHCRKCGSEIKEEDKFCKHCGTSVRGNNLDDESIPAIENTPISVDTPAVGDTEVKAGKSPKNQKKWIALALILGVLFIMGLAVKIISGNNDKTLLAQIERKYELDIPEIKAEGGSAVGNVTLEDHLPYEGYRRYMTMINSTDGTENVVEEVTMYLTNGISAYSSYNYLAQFSVQGALEMDESGEYYYTVQQDWWNTSNTVTDIYIGLPEKTWTIGTDAKKQVIIAPEFYTVSTPHGTYEKCLLKYTHDSDLWSHEFSAYAPNGMGKVMDISWSTEMVEDGTSPIYYYTYNPDSTTTAAIETSPPSPDVSQEMPDDAMLIQDLLDNEDADFWMNGNSGDAYKLTIQSDGKNEHLYMFNSYQDKIVYSGILNETSEGIHIIGDEWFSEGTLEYISQGELKLTVGSDIYQFVKL